MAGVPIVLYRVDVVFVGNVVHLCAEARLDYKPFFEGKRFFTETGKTRGASRVRVPKRPDGSPDFGWARSEYEAWQVAIERARTRREQVIVDMQLESARTHALLVGASWVDPKEASRG